jgi:hypothetical protein
MADSAATKALVMAGQAQDTADGKRRVFVNTPYPPYDVGDLWVQGTTGDLMRCQTARLSGNYAASDWVKGVKYTDDSSLNSFVTNYAVDKANMTSQIDGKIESFFQSNDPSASWTTSALRSAHAGDMWYNTSAKTLHRYTGSTWERIEDADAIAAASAASAAQTAVSAKATTFTSQPVPPYRVGDLWLSGDSQAGSLKKCVTGRTSGSYSASDWQNVGIYDNAGVAIQKGLNISGGFLTFAGNGGMSGDGTVRIWAGGSISNPTFRVTDEGDVYSKSTIYVGDTSTNAKAGMSAKGSENSSVRIWAGIVAANMASAPFRVTQDGSLYSTKGEIAGFVIGDTSIRSKSSAYSSGGESFWYSQGSSAFLGFSGSGKWAGIGLNVLPATLGGTSALLRLEDTAEGGTIKYNMFMDTRGGSQQNVHLLIARAGGYSDSARPITIESRKFSNDASSFYRTCIRLGMMPSRSQIETLGTVKGHLVYWDENSHYLYWE